MSRTRERILLICTLLACAPVFLLGITWGLPSRAADPFLFGDHPVWSGKEIAALAGDRSSNASLGADVDRNPIAPNAGPIVLNENDQQRAEIVRRYRLYTYQPDEMITMMALASMRPSARDFDPKLYQYGGLWIYPVGALIKVFAHPRADSVYYLDHPEEFARFYVIARLYTVAWAIVGAWAVFWILRRLTGQPLLAAATTLCYALMPVVVNLAHEAKPHLPAAVLILLATIAATKFIESGLKRYWALAGMLVGAAAGMVLSAIPAIAILPIMCWLRREMWSQRLIILIASLVIAVDVYFITNPYVLIHLLHDRTVLLSNFRNSQAMYQAPPSLSGFFNAAKLIALGSGVLIFGVLGIRQIKSHAILQLLAGVCGLVLVQFFLLATNKPAEYARFAIVPDVALAMLAFAGISKFQSRRASMLAGAMVVLTAVLGVSYVWHFVDDSSKRPPRVIAAERLQKLAPSTIALAAEPAPYSVPPIDLFKTRLILHGSGADVAIRTVDRVTSSSNVEYWGRPRLLPTPISWAHKPFEVRINKPATVPSAR